VTLDNLPISYVAIAIFAAVFLLIVAFAAFAYERLSQRNRRLRERIRTVVEGSVEEDDTGYIILRDDSYSKIPFLDRLLTRFQFVKILQKRIDESGVPIKAGALILAILSLGGMVFLLAASVFSSSLLATILSGPVALLPYLWVMWKRHKRLDRFDELLPEAIDLIVNALRSGYSLEASFGLVAQELPQPLGPEFAIAFEEQNLGLNMGQALENLNYRIPSDDLKILTTAISIQKRAGGNLAEILDNISKMIRDRYRMRREVRILTAQGRFSGLVLVLLPIAFALIISVFNRDYIKILVDDPAGHYMVGVAVLLQIIGMLAIRRIIRLKV